MSDAGRTALWDRRQRGLGWPSPGAGRAGADVSEPAPGTASVPEKAAGMARVRATVVGVERKSPTCVGGSLRGGRGQATGRLDVVVNNAGNLLHGRARRARRRVGRRLRHQRKGRWLVSQTAARTSPSTAAAQSQHGSISAEDRQPADEWQRPTRVQAAVHQLTIPGSRGAPRAFVSGSTRSPRATSKRPRLAPGGRDAVPGQMESTTCPCSASRAR